MGRRGGAGRGEGEGGRERDMLRACILNFLLPPLPPPSTPASRRVIPPPPPLELDGVCNYLSTPIFFWYVHSRRPVLLGVSHTLTSSPSPLQKKYVAKSDIFVGKPNESNLNSNEFQESRDTQ